MLLPAMRIEIGDWLFEYGVDVEIIQSIDTLTDTCKITVPRRTEWNGKTIAIGDTLKGDEPILKRGDKVKVQLGYDGVLVTRFIGFIKNIKSGIPVTIECEDSMFLLKQGKQNFTFPGGNIRLLLEKIVPKEIEFKTPGKKDIYIPQIRFSNVSPARILEELKSKMGLYCYFRNITEAGKTRAIMYCGLAYWEDTFRKEETFEFGFNIIDPFALVYKRSEDIRLKAKAISWQRNNTKVEFEVGDDDGETRTIHAYGLTKDQLIVYAKAELERYKYTGYSGSLETFGEPAVEKNDIINLIGNKYHPSQKLMVNEVRVKCGVDGYRQTISPGPIANDTTNTRDTPSR